jgi:NAD(P)H-flavin reductase
MNQHLEKPTPMVWPNPGLTRVPYDVYTDPRLALMEQERIFRGDTWNFEFIPAVEDAGDAQALGGFHGRVDDAVRAHRDSLAGYEVYCCGAPAMVTAVRMACVQERGLDPHHFFSDVFVPGPAAI